MCKLVVFAVIEKEGEEKTFLVKNELSSNEIHVFPLVVDINNLENPDDFDWQNELYGFCTNFWGKVMAKKIDFSKASVISGYFTNGAAAVSQNKKYYVAVKFVLPEAVPLITLKGQKLIEMSANEIWWMMRVKLNHAGEVEDAKVRLESVHEGLIRIFLNFEVLKTLHHLDFSGGFFVYRVSNFR